MLRPLLTAIVLILLVTGSADAQQDSAKVSTTLPKVFLDCQARGCDDEYIRSELTWLNFVRDRSLASVHVLATSRGTASGGSELTVAFIGVAPGQTEADTIVQFTGSNATQSERRDLLTRVIGQGMLEFVDSTPLGGRLSVTYDAPESDAATQGTRGAEDPWNLWVFRVSGGTWFNGEESRKSTSMNGSFSASRITEGFKTILSLDGNYNENHYTLSDSATFASYRHGYSGEALFVKSLDEHWSFGVQANMSSSQTSNLDLGLRIGPAIEYDLFPYAESTRRQVIARYSVGVKSLQYDSLTIFDEISEVLPDHKFVLAAEATQPWGDVGGGIQFAQYLHDMSKYELNLEAGVSWRLAQGLNLNFDMGYSKIRDQINIRRGDASDEEVYLNLRQLETGYEYRGSVGISYTFGSIFSNVVNPRFSENTGGWFFGGGGGRGFRGFR